MLAELELKADFINALRQVVIQDYQKALTSGEPPSENINYPITKKSPVQNERDFQYGLAVGVIRYASLVYFKQWYGRDSTKQEGKEMYAVIRRCVSELEDYFYKADLR